MHSAVAPRPKVETPRGQGQFPKRRGAFAAEPTIRLCSMEAFGPSKSACEFDPKTSSVLLNRVFRILGAAGIEIFLVEKIENAGRNVQVFSDCVSEQREVDHLIAG